MKYYKFIILTFCIGIYFFVNAGFVNAQTDPYTFKFQPTNLVVSAAQGSRFREDIYVENDNTTKSLQASLFIRNFKASNGGEMVSFYKPSSPSQDISTWVKPELSTITLLPQEKLYVTLDFTIPDYVASGTYTGVLFINTNFSNQSSVEGSNVALEGGINLIINIYKDASGYASLYKGPIIEGVHVPFFNTTNAITFSGDIKNLGKFIESTSTTISVHNIMFQNVNEKKFLNVDVLPGMYRYFDGKDKTITIPNLGFGFYKLHIQVKDNLKDATIVQDYYFTILPLYSIIVLFLILSILGLLIYAIRRKSKRKYYR